MTSATITTAAGVVWFAIRVRKPFPSHRGHFFSNNELINSRRTTRHGLTSRICNGDQDHVPDVFIRDLIYRVIYVRLLIR